MELIDRFQHILKLNQLSASAFADQIGVQRSSVSHVLSGRNKPSLEFLQKVLTSFPRVDANWLINGVTKVKPHQNEVIQEDVQKSEESSVSESKIKAEAKEDAVRKVVSDGSKIIARVLIFYTDHTFEEFSSQ